MYILQCLYIYNIPKRIIVKDQNLINMQLHSSLLPMQYYLKLLKVLRLISKDQISKRVYITIDDDVTQVATHLKIKYIIKYYKGAQLLKKKNHNKLSAIILSIRLSLTGPEDHTFPRKKIWNFLVMCTFKYCVLNTDSF